MKVRGHITRSPTDLGSTSAFTPPLSIDISYVFQVRNTKEDQLLGYKVGSDEGHELPHGTATASDLQVFHIPQKCL
ncbi:hypothetical protein KOW79_007513 [Hemibagrus wyckioides]|uniref:Uncharacterized protein n=1 Tax=Hemibagrus wyckioides TaxID=337641 RepID=A0A9D3NW68_9TELE|nr:hypothetical protein KOW79_007513 [Hemibagrus wyckioides]